MKKISLILIFILGFFVVFSVSAAVTFLLTVDRDDVAEEATEAVYVPDTVVLPEGDEITAETTVTRVTPALARQDAIIVREAYGEKVEESSTEGYAMPEVEDLPLPVVETKKEEVKAEENKAEEKKEETKTEEKHKDEEKKTEVKAEDSKAEEKKEEVKTEEVKAEVKKEEVKVEEPKIEEPKVEEKKEEVKAEEPKAEEKKEEVKVELDPNKQYSDTGI